MVGRMISSVQFLSKKNNQTDLKKNRNRTETGSNRPVLVCFLGQKPVQIGLALFFRFGSVFFGWVWFGFFGFRTELIGFFKILIFFFYGLFFSVIFFIFLVFLVFLLTPNADTIFLKGFPFFF
jgi:hypothetical protein